MNKYRSHLCSELSISDLGNKVTFSLRLLIDRSEQKCVLYLFIFENIYNISFINGIVNCLFFSRDNISSLLTISWIPS